MLGDHWSLIVIRDVMFGNRRHYGDLLRLSEEGIASNILANRLKHLMNTGLLSRTEDPEPISKKRFTALPRPRYNSSHCWPRWGLGDGNTLRCRNNSPFERRSSKRVANECGKPSWRKLRSLHLGTRAPRRSVFAELQAAFESSVKRQTKTGK